MSRAQRLAYLAIAAVIAVVAVVIIAGGDDPETAETPTETPTAAATEAPADADATPEATETPTEEPTPEPTPAPPLLEAGEETELEAVEGDTVTFRVRADEADEVHVHGYDITRELEPGKTETVSFEATITGIFEIELHHAQPPLIGTLTVEPS